MTTVWLPCQPIFCRSAAWSRERLATPLPWNYLPQTETQYPQAHSVTRCDKKKHTILFQFLSCLDRMPSPHHTATTHNVHHGYQVCSVVPPGLQRPSCHTVQGGHWQGLAAAAGWWGHRYWGHLTSAYSFHMSLCKRLQEPMARGSIFEVQCGLTEDHALNS